MLCPSCGHDNIEGFDRCENCAKPLRDLDVPRADATYGFVRSMMEDDLRKLGRDQAIIARPGESLSDVLRRMKEESAACALVVDEGRELAGILTPTDVLPDLMNEGKKSDLVRDLVRPNPETLKVTDSVAAALNKMAFGRLQYIPVVEADNRYSVVSIKNILEYLVKENW